MNQEDKKVTPKGGEISAILKTYYGASEEENKPLKVATIISIAFYTLLMWIVFPEAKRVITEEKKAEKVVVIKQFKLPPPKKKEPPKRTTTATVKTKTRAIPIPDPTPDEPEPYQEWAEIVDEYEPPPPDTEFDFGPPELPPEPLRVGGDVSKPVRIKYVDPEYPELARKARIEGLVILEAIIDENGNVVKARILRSPGKAFGFDEAALEAVKQWKFKPGLQNGVPVPVIYALTVEFKLTK